MNVLDRAFIRAYSKTAAEADAGNSGPAAPIESSLTMPQRVEARPVNRHESDLASPQAEGIAESQVAADAFVAETRSRFAEPNHPEQVHPEQVDTGNEWKPDGQTAGAEADVRVADSVQDSSGELHAIDAAEMGTPSPHFPVVDYNDELLQMIREANEAAAREQQALEEQARAAAVEQADLETAGEDETEDNESETAEYVVGAGLAARDDVRDEPMNVMIQWAAELSEADLYRLAEVEAEPVSNDQEPVDVQESEPTAQTAPTEQNESLDRDTLDIMEAVRNAVESFPNVQPLPMPEPVSDSDAVGPGDTELDEATPVAPLVPVWEVDGFQWPALCGKLNEAMTDRLADSGKELYAATEDGLQILLISGVQRGEGRTSIALCIAKSVAEAGGRVALVDADFENPQVGSRLGIEVPVSWPEVLAQELPLEEAVVYSNADQVAVLAMQASCQGEGTTLTDPRVVEMLQTLRKHYDLVIIDGAPMSPANGIPTTRSEIDAAIVVRDVRDVSEAATMGAVRGLRHAGIAAVGVAENFCERT